MNNVSIFTFRKMPVRAVERNGENFFVIRDICNILGWSNPNRELAKHTENVPLYERILMSLPSLFRHFCRNDGKIRRLF